MTKIPSLSSSMIRKNREINFGKSKPVNDMSAPANSASVKMMRDFIKDQEEERRVDIAYDLRTGARDHLEPWQRRTRFGIA